MKQEQHRATARVLDILEYLAAANGDGHTLTELAAALDAPKSSLFPIIHTLAERKYIQLERDTGKYCIGIGTYALGESFVAGKDSMELTLQAMSRVVSDCEETCQLAVLDGDKVLYLGKVDSPHAIRMISHVGARLPANSTALGKALLSGLTDSEVRELYAEGMHQMTEHTINDIDVLLEQINQVRGGAPAWEREESNLHISCCAVPICSKGKVLAAVSVSVPIFRLDEDKERVVTASLFRAKKEIEQLSEERGFFL
ncbi:Pectin degradation repressor protein KdgR [bioreactor metagenome]|uniref:Pectin degradation repressor protein KdgR n=1 Tax=bioreactor metagenome TaxID=1076179 RepID=A0A645BK03_9ZZZZ